MSIDARGLDHRALNQALRGAVATADGEIEIVNVNGHRYIAAGFRSEARIRVRGVAGNDLGAFMDGPRIVVEGNAQDGAGNTMNAGLIAVRGDARDVTGYAMRGGRIFILGDVGYRAGIHMKAYKESFPTIVVGGSCGDFLGEYMAGGVIVVLNRAKQPCATGIFTGTGMHGGTIYIRGGAPKERLAKEVGAGPLEEADRQLLAQLVGEFCECFGLAERYSPAEFVKYRAFTHRPYGQLYAY